MQPFIRLTLAVTPGRDILYSGAIPLSAAAQILTVQLPLQVTTDISQIINKFHWVEGVVSTFSQNLHKRGEAKGTSIKSVGTYPIIIVHL